MSSKGWFEQLHLEPHGGRLRQGGPGFTPLLATQLEPECAQLPACLTDWANKRIIRGLTQPGRNGSLTEKMEAALDLTATVLASTLGSVLLLSAVAKLRNFNTFSIVTLGQLGVAARIAPTTAVTVLVLEAGLAAALATASYPAAVGLATAALLTAYVLVGLYAVWLKRPIPCGCFAGSRMTLGIQTATRAGILALLAGMLTLCSTAGGHPSSGSTLILIAVFLTTKWLLDWRQLSKPLGWR